MRRRYDVMCMLGIWPPCPPPPPPPPPNILHLPTPMWERAYLLVFHLSCFAIGAIFVFAYPNGVKDKIVSVPDFCRLIYLFRLMLGRADR